MKITITHVRETGNMLLTATEGEKVLFAEEFPARTTLLDAVNVMRFECGMNKVEGK